jgi:hypothetical protein
LLSNIDLDAKKSYYLFHQWQDAEGRNHQIIHVYCTYPDECFYHYIYAIDNRIQWWGQVDWTKQLFQYKNDVNSSMTLRELNDFVEISGNFSKNSSVIIFDVNGKIHTSFSQDEINSSISISRSKFVNGVNFIFITTETGTKTFKIINQK